MDEVVGSIPTGSTNSLSQGGVPRSPVDGVSAGLLSARVIPKATVDSANSTEVIF